MATVPLYGGPQQNLQALPGVRQRVATPPEMFGDGGAFAKGIGDGLDQGAQIMRAEQDLADQTRVDEALNKYKEYELDLTFNPESGYVTQKGKQVMYRDSGKPLTDEYYENANQYTSNLENSLSNDRQKAEFRRRANDQLIGLKGNLMRHEVSEFRGYQLSVQEGKIATEARTVASYYNNPDKVNQSIAEIRNSVYTAGRLQGESAEQISAKTAAMVSAAHYGALEQAMGNGEVMLADQYLKTYKDQMTPDDLLRARGKIGEQVETVVATKTANVVFGKIVAADNPDDMTRVLAITEQSESGGKRYGSDGAILTSPKGAKGEMQVMDATNGDPGFGVKPAQNDSPDERARVGRDYMGAMIKNYGGDITRAWAAYNAGPGAVDKAVAEAKAEGKPGSWLSKLPKETQDYVVKNSAAYKSGGGKPPVPTIDQAKAELRANPAFADRPSALRKAEEELDRLYTDREKGIKQRQDAALDEALKFVESGGTFSTLPAALKNNMDPGSYTAVREYEKKVRSGNTETDLTVYQLLAGDPKRVRAMSDVEFNALRKDLSPGDFKKFSDMRADQNNAKDSPSAIDFEAVNQVLNPRLRGLGLPQSGGSPAEQQRAGAIRQHVTDVVLQRQRQLGRKLTDLEVVQAVDERFVATRGFKASTYWGMGKDEVRKQNIMRTTVSDIPSDLRRQIEADYKAQGIDKPSNQDLLTAFFNLDYQMPKRE